MPEGKQSPNILSLPFGEALYAQYLRDPSAVPQEWRSWFEGLAEPNGFASDPRLEPSFPRRGLFGRVPDRNGSRANAPFISAELEPSYVDPVATTSGPQPPPASRTAETRAGNRPSTPAPFPTRAGCAPSAARSG